MKELRTDGTWYSPATIWFGHFCLQVFILKYEKFNIQKYDSNTQKYTFACCFILGVKFGLSHWGKTRGWEFSTELRETSGLQTDEVMGKWRRFYSEEFHRLYLLKKCHSIGQINNYNFIKYNRYKYTFTITRCIQVFFLAVSKLQ